MKNWHFRKTSVAVAAVAVLCLTVSMPAQAPARSFVQPPHTGQFVNVSVSFNTQMPLPDMSENKLAAAQKSGRMLMYRLAGEECAVLKEVVAETCRLTNLNVSTQIRQRHNNNPPTININGSARFSITLKKENGG